MMTERPNSLRFGVTRSAGREVVRLSGELDLATADVAARAIAVAGPRSRTGLVVDVVAVTFMDAAGLNVLLSQHERLVDRNGTGLRIQGACGVVRRVLELTGSTWLMGPADEWGPSRSDEIDGLRWRLGLSMHELFLDYVALGGTVPDRVLRAFLRDGGRLPTCEEDVLVLAVNERARLQGHPGRVLRSSSKRAA